MDGIAANIKDYHLHRPQSEIRCLGDITGWRARPGNDSGVKE